MNARTAITEAYNQHGDDPYELAEKIGPAAVMGYLGNREDMLGGAVAGEVIADQGEHYPRQANDPRAVTVPHYMSMGRIDVLGGVIAGERIEDDVLLDVNPMGEFFPQISESERQAQQRLRELLERQRQREVDAYNQQQQQQANQGK